jgi:hypothetical protein
MTINSSAGHIIASQMNEWFSSKAFVSVKLEQRFIADPEHNTDYYVVHESIFEPTHIECAMVEIFVTSDGDIGIGLEMRGRIANRLRVRNFREGYAAGFEPIGPSNIRLIPFLEMVSNAQVHLIARTWPMIGLGGVSAAVALQSGQTEPIKRGLNYWPKRMKTGKPQSGIIPFSPWS